MQNVHRLRAIKFLTEQQTLTAFKFFQSPNSFNVSPTIFRILREVIILETPLEVMEEKMGWPARSAKAILSVLLFALEETEGLFWRDLEESPDIEDLKATVDYLTGDSIPEQSEVMQRFYATQKEAKLFLILQRSKGEVVRRDTILNRLYDAHEIDKVPDAKIIDVFVCKLRPKIEKAGFRIENVWGEGYRLIFAGTEVQANRDMEWWKAHAKDGVSMREIARRSHVAPSTVLRGIRRAEEAQEDFGVKLPPELTRV
jgi:DNA-binding winged helix-turn-helix (wHTH) protein